MKIKGIVWVARHSATFYKTSDNYGISFVNLRPIQNVYGKWLAWRDCVETQLSMVYARHFHRTFPHVRLKPGAGPIRVLMLGLPLDRLTDEQVATLREEADHLEAVCVGMRSETS